ncbi:MAG: AAA family ATPase [Bacteroidales bacterium]|nr:AAA family ATPase [Bacteroidales bacterium]
MNLNELFPSTAIRGTNKELFVGRAKVLKESLIYAQKPGAVLVIIGERGIGKSSLAWQTLSVLSGNTEIFEMQSYKFSKTNLNKYNCVYVECNSDTNNIDGIIKKLLVKEDSNKTDEEQKNIYSLYKELNQAQEYTKLLQENIGISEPENIDIKENNQDFSLPDKLKDRFINLIKKINEQLENELIIFIDEFDAIKDKGGISDLLKTAHGVKFVIIGIGDGIHDIIEDHKSTKRKIRPIILDRLTEKDIEDYISKAQVKIGNTKISFKDDFSKNVYTYSDGYPPLVQKFCDTVMDIIQLEDLENEKVFIDDIYFEKSFKKVLDDETMLNVDLELWRKKVNYVGKEKILFFLAEYNGWIKEKDLKVKNTYRFKDNIKELLQDCLIKKDSYECYKFLNPYFRLIVKDIVNKNGNLYIFEKKTN